MECRYDWPTIANTYITADVSYRDLSEKFDIPLGTITARAARDKWTELREKYRQTLKQKEIEAFAVKNAADCTDHMEPLQKAADRLAVYTMILMAKLPTDPDRVDSQTVRQLSASLKDLAAVMRSVYDIPTEDQLTARQVAVRKMALEERKADAEDAEEKEINVTMSDEVKELFG